MDDHTFVYRERIGFTGANVRSMYQVYQWLYHLCRGLEADKVRVFSSNYGHNKRFLFHHLSQMKNQVNHEKMDFTVRSQAAINRLLRKNDQELARLKERGETALCDPTFDYLDRQDKDGSYITFHDQENLLEGKIIYLDERTLPELQYHLGKVVLGNGLGLGFSSLGLYSNSPALLNLGLAVAVFLSADGFWKSIRVMNQQCFETEIKLKDDSEKAIEKLENLCQQIKKD